MQESSPPAHLSEDDQFSDQQPNGWAGWFDAMATLIEHLRLIVGGTLLVGVVALAVSFVLHKSYTSVSYVGPLEDAEAKTAESVIRSPLIMNSVLQKFPEYEPQFDPIDRRQQLNDRTRWHIAKGANPKSALYSLEVTDDRPDRAQKILKSIIDTWLDATAPRPDERANLEKLVEANETQLNDLGTVIDEMKKQPNLLKPDIQAGYVPPNISEMIKTRTDTEAKINDLKWKLKAKSRDLIFEVPDLPTKASGPRKLLIVASSTIAAFAALVAFVLLRHFLQMAAERPGYAPFFERIDQAMHRRRTRG